MWTRRTADATTAANCDTERRDRRGVGAYFTVDPAGQTRREQAHVDVREVVNGVMYILGTGCQWRAIPKDLPPRSTIMTTLTSGATTGRWIACITRCM